MNNENWTKGNWEAFFYGIGCGESLVATVAPRPASNQSDDFKLDEGMANARLIAAAPELCEALKQVLEDDNLLDYVQTETLYRCEKALAKARGEL